MQELKDKFKRHAVHVCHGQHGNHVVAPFHFASQHLLGKLIVRPQCPVGNHHPFRVRGCAAGVVYQSQVIGSRLVGVANVVFAEILGVFTSEEFVQPFASLSQLFCSGNEQGIVPYCYDTFQVRHIFGLEFRPYHVAHKQYFGLRMVHDVMHLFSFELMEDGHSHGTVAQHRHEGGSPVGTVASAEGNFVAGLYAGIFKKDVELLNLAGHVFILQCNPLVVGQCIEVPIVLETFRNDVYEIGVCFHFSLGLAGSRFAIGLAQTSAHSFEFCAKVVKLRELFMFRSILFTLILHFCWLIGFKQGYFSAFT